MSIGYIRGDVSPRIGRLATSRTDAELAELVPNGTKGLRTLLERYIDVGISKSWFAPGDARLLAGRARGPGRGPPAPPGLNGLGHRLDGAPTLARSEQGVACCRSSVSDVRAMEESWAGARRDSGSTSRPTPSGPWPGNFGGIGGWMPGIDSCDVDGDDRILKMMGMEITTASNGATRAPR